MTEVTLKEFLGGSYGPLIDLIKAGKIRGIAGIVGCSNLRAEVTMCSPLSWQGK